MKVGRTIPPEKQIYRDAETGRTVTHWTGDARHNLGHYYHQNMFDPQRGLAYFASDGSGSYQVWRVSLDDGRLTQVSDFDGFGECLSGSDERTNAAHSAAYVSRHSGRVYVAGRQQIGVIDPDSLECRVVYDNRKPKRDRDERYLREVSVFPSYDDRWVYSYSVFASDAEVDAAKQFAQAVMSARQRAGQIVQGCYHHAPYGMRESPLEHVILRVEVATGKIEELWRGHWWIQHVQVCPTDPDLVTFVWAALCRPPKPKYHLLRAGETPKILVTDEPNFAFFHDFWHPNGKMWLTHACENLAPGEVYAPIPGKMKFYVCEVDVGDFLKTEKADVKRSYETAGESHVHMHLNIAPGGSFLVGDGQSDVPYICRLDYQPDLTLKASALCRIGYCTGKSGGIETSPNVQVSPDGRQCFFTAYRGDRSYLASVECA